MHGFLHPLSPDPSHSINSSAIGGYTEYGWLYKFCALKLFKF